MLVRAIIIGLITVFTTPSAHGAWPAAPWQDLPKLEYVYNAADTIWFYSVLEVGGYPPRYVVTYDKHRENMTLHPVSSRPIPKDAPIEFRKSRAVPAYLNINSSEIVDTSSATQGISRITLPKLTLEEKKRLLKWSGNDRLLNHLTLNNAFQGSFKEVDGVHYLGMKGGFSEGIGWIGGLVVYRPSEKEITILRSKYLANCSVTGFSQIGDELAMSTVYYGEGGIGGGGYYEQDKWHPVGLVMYNTRTEEWRNISTENSSLSGDIIFETKVVNDTIWLITNWGITSYQPKTGRLRSWTWSLGLSEKQ